MAGNLNKVTLIGHIGRDPEIRNTNDGKEIANFTLATSESWKDRMTGERKEKTEWHRVVVFSEGLVKIIKSYVKKGTKLYLEGQLQTRKWVDNMNQDKYTTEIILQNFNSTLILLDSRGSDSYQTQQSDVTNNSMNPNTISNTKQTTSAGNFNNSELDDDVPF